jgi:hypothetical protein
VYSSIINAGSLDMVQRIVETLFINIALLYGNEAVNNFKWSLEHSELFQTQDGLNRLSAAIGKTEAKQIAFETFKDEWMNPKKSMFSRFTGFFSNSSSGAAAESPKVKTTF